MEHPTTIGDYKLLETIGRGAFSTVYRAKHRNSSREVAIKIIQKDSISRDLVEREVLILKSLDHPFAVAFYEFFENENYYYFVMEHVQGESIHEHLKKYGHFPEWLCKHYFCQLISVLDYLHNELRIAHRDLKLDNIMVDRHGNIRLVDFGLGNAYKGSSAVLQTACGSPRMFI
ncbi:hypothetical protein TRFO_34784 [Tritrichomonas foetus]|uniref:Protein kinase domain-containing protein n=1 Tax=Tritrichomonas foetus TaxID=1144522 RepID=A0A1J4JI72_9EUKA|nr:hypothetical protein TRFO_34784 [Tritrichomonas foetus]|eukprot:OHS98880.1 hypothetical protein TRFO_34784 [Tritrichomonas foetus]